MNCSDFVIILTIDVGRYDKLQLVASEVAKYKTGMTMDDYQLNGLTCKIHKQYSLGYVHCEINAG